MVKKKSKKEDNLWIQIQKSMIVNTVMASSYLYPELARRKRTPMILRLTQLIYLSSHSDEPTISNYKP